MSNNIFQPTSDPSKTVLPTSLAARYTLFHDYCVCISDINNFQNFVDFSWYNNYTSVCIKIFIGSTLY